MPHELDLIFTLTGGLAVALGLGLLTQRLRMSPIVGYLLAGVVVGPFTPGFVADKPLATRAAGALIQYVHETQNGAAG